MNKNQKSYGLIFFSILLSAYVIYVCILFKPVEKKIHNYYQVYLGGERIGLIDSADKLYAKINEEQKKRHLKQCLFIMVEKLGYLYLQSIIFPSSSRRCMPLPRQKSHMLQSVQGPVCIHSRSRYCWNLFSHTSVNRSL